MWIKWRRKKVIMTKTECIEIFNAMIRGTPVSFQDKLLPMFSDFLTENNVENSDKMISLVVQNPQLIQQFFPKIVDYFGKKYNMLSLNNVLPNGQLNPIMYYE